MEIKALVRDLFGIPKILFHRQFDECGENKDRSSAHMLVLYAFISLFIVTGIFFFTLYVLQIHGPYSQMNPVKWLANIAGVALILGSILLIKNRLSKTDQTSSYVDWYLLGLVLGLGLTGMGTEITRFLGWAGISTGCILYTLYLCLCYLPFCRFPRLADSCISDSGHGLW